MRSEIIPQPNENLELIGSLLKRDPRLGSEHTRRGYKADLTRFEEWRAGRRLSKLLVEEFAAEMQRAGKSPATVNRALAAVRWWARRLADLAQENQDLEPGQVEEVVKQTGRVAAVGDVKGKREPKGRQISEGEIKAIMQTCENDPTPAGARDAALFAVAWFTGARQSELAGLGFSSFQRTGEGEAEILIRKGKGNKDRIGYLYNGAYLAVEDWLKIRGSDDGPLFCAIGKGGKVKPEQGLSGEALRLILEKRIGEAKVKPFTWHDFRRSFISDMIAAGADLVVVSKLAGHENIETTAGYDRRPVEAQRRAMEKRFVPYRGRMV